MFPVPNSSPTIPFAEGNDPTKPRWNKAKSEHKRFMNGLLTCDMHVILCLRAREKAKPEVQIIDGKKKTVYVDLGLQAITEKNVMFEATVSLMLHESGKRQDVVKPGDDALLPYIGRGQGYITADDGAAIRRWVDGAQQLDPKVEKYRNRLLSITDKGKAYVEESWGQVPEAIRTALGDAFKATLIAAAVEYEKQAAEAKDDGDVAGLNAAISSAVAAPKPANDNEPPPQEGEAELY